MVMQEYIHNCSFCGKSQDQVQSLIAGPGSTYICNECIDLSREIIEEESAFLPPDSDQTTSSLPETYSSNAKPNMLFACSFCGKSQDQVQRLIAGPGGVYICNECTDLCRKIIEEHKT